MSTTYLKLFRADLNEIKLCQCVSILLTRTSTVHATGPPNVLSDAISLGGKKIPMDFEFLCALFGWLGILFEKKLSSFYPDFAQK